MKGKCSYCSAEFDYYPSQQSGRYCSNSCQHRLRRKELVESGQSKDHRSVREYLIERNIYECVMCGNTGQWQGKELTLQLDHIDGNSKNNQLNNVRWVCPNCHTQTDTWGHGNISDANRHKLSTKGL